MDTPFLQTPPRGASPILMPFFFFFFLNPTQLCGDLSCSFVCIRDLLPVSGLFSMRIVLHVDVIFGIWRGT